MNNLKWLAVPALMAVGLLLVWLPPQVVALSGYAALSREAEAVVDGATAQNLAAFASVSAIKTGLAIVEDSSVGVGFQIQLGDAVQAVYDYVDFVWEALLYSLLVLGAYKMLIETQLLHLGLQIIGAGLLLWGAGLALPRLPEGLRRLGPRLAFGGVLFAGLVPGALLGMHFATKHYTGPLKARHAARIDELRGQVEAVSAQFGALKSSVDILHPLDSAGAVRAQVGQLTTALSTAAAQGTQAMLYYVVIVLFELLIFPIVTALLLFKLVQALFGRALERATTRGPAIPTPA